MALIDLGLTLKHVHWNVVGPAFIGVHKMLDPQVEAVQVMVDATAERIATLGASPNGLAGNIVKSRTWDDYAIGRASTQAHLGALDMAYGGVVEGHREAIDKTESIDPVTQDLLIEQSERAGAVPLVRPRAPRDAGRRARDRGRQEREVGRQDGEHEDR